MINSPLLYHIPYSAFVFVLLSVKNFSLRINGHKHILLRQTGSFLRGFPLQYPIVYPCSIQYLIPNNNNKYLIPQRKNSISIITYLLTHPHYYFLCNKKIPGFYSRYFHFILLPAFPLFLYQFIKFWGKCSNSFRSFIFMFLR